MQQKSQDTNSGIIFIDHLGKPKAGYIGDPVDEIMNSTAKTATADTILALYKEPGKSGANLKGRGRDIEEINLALQFDLATFSWQSRGDAKDLAAAETRAEIISVLQNLGKAQSTTIAKAIGKDRSWVHRLLNEMSDDNLVIRLPAEGKLFWEVTQQ